MAAEVEQMPDDLRATARRIPADCMANMTMTEAVIRATYCHDLISRSASESPDRAKHTLRLAEKVLKSLSADAYNAEYSRLSRELADANKRGDSPAAYEAYSALRQLERDNPRIPDERVLAHAAGVIAKAAEERLAIPPVRQSRIFNRNMKRK
jgi:hypothetical protein